MKLTLEQAARQALEALEVATTPMAKDRQEVLRAIAALREALEAAPHPAAPTQDPAAWAITYDGQTPHTLWHEGDGPLLDLEIKRQGGSARKMALYTAHQPAHQPAPQPAAFHDDHVAVPRSLIGAACSAIGRKLDAPQTLLELRRYTIGDHSFPIAPLPARQPLTRKQVMQIVAENPDTVAAIRMTEALHGITGGQHDGS